MLFCIYIDKLLFNRKAKGIGCFIGNKFDLKMKVKNVDDLVGILLYKSFSITDAFIV